MEEGEESGNAPVKVVFVGDTGVGKTSILQRYAYDLFKDDNPPTIGVAFISKKVQLAKPKVCLNFHIWDTAGQERYRSIAKTQYQDAFATIIVFDVTKRETYDGLKEWMREVKENMQDKGVIVIAANKADLVEEETVAMAEARDYAREANAQLFMTSAKTNIGIQDLFTSLARTVIAKWAADPELAVIVLPIER
jgi:small GTP-binding protein